MTQLESLVSITRDLQRPMLKLGVRASGMVCVRGHRTRSTVRAMLPVAIDKDVLVRQLEHILASTGL